MTHKYLLASALMALSLAAWAQTAPGINKHASVKGIACATCHASGQYGPVPAGTCKGCHAPEALARSTERLNFQSQMKDAKTGTVKSHTAKINPHDSFHFGRTEDCVDCHRNHTTSVNDCATCHDVKAWGMKDPG